MGKCRDVIAYTLIVFYAFFICGSITYTLLSILPLFIPLLTLLISHKMICALVIGSLGSICIIVVFIGVATGKINISIL